MGQYQPMMVGTRGCVPTTGASHYSAPKVLKKRLRSKRNNADSISAGGQQTSSLCLQGSWREPGSVLSQFICALWMCRWHTVQGPKEVVEGVPSLGLPTPGG